MSEFEEGWPPAWFHDISSAFALSKQTTPERRLQASWRRSRLRLCG